MKDKISVDEICDLMEEVEEWEIEKSPTADYSCHGKYKDFFIDAYKHYPYCLADVIEGEYSVHLYKSYSEGNKELIRKVSAGRFFRNKRIRKIVGRMVKEYDNRKKKEKKERIENAKSELRRILEKR